MGKPQEISNPRRILAVALDDQAEVLCRIVKDLTGTPPESNSTSLAGTTHDLTLQTAYYNATVPIWLDMIGTPSEWTGSFLSDEAKEVLEVLGGVVVVFAIPSPAATPSTDSQPPQTTRDLITHVGRVVKEGLGGWEWDGVSLAVGVGDVAHMDDLDTWDEVCGDAGLEFVHVASSTTADARNEFGEKVGVPRVLEALQSNDWASVPTMTAGEDEELVSGADDNEDADDELDLENLDFGFDKEDFDGLKKAIWEAKMEREGFEMGQNGEPSTSATATAAQPPAKDKTERNEAADNLDDSDIQKVEEMMRKLQAVRDMSSGLPEDQRKRLAARAVGEVMRDL